MKNKRFFYITFVLILIATFLIPTSAFADDSITGKKSPTVFSIPDKGPYFGIILKSTVKAGKAQDELLEKRLAHLEYDEKGNLVSGGIDIQAITKLIDQGIYWIDNNKQLRVDKVIESEVFTPGVTRSSPRRWATMVTRTLEIFDNFNYRGVDCYVTTPETVTMDPDTTFNLCSTHLCQGDSSHWIEAGIMWLYDYDNPWLFTYDTYGNGYKWQSTSSGGVSTTVHLIVQVYSDYSASMYAYDSGSYVYIYTECDVNTLNSRADVCQEQYSDAEVFSETGEALIDRNKLKNTSSQWVNWNNSINTDWDNDAPLYENHGISNDMKWIETWCDP